MQLKLTDEEMQEVYLIAQDSDLSVESLLSRLELLTWGDGLLEFRMQSGSPTGLLHWMEQLSDLGKRISGILRSEGIPFGPSLEAYEAWLATQQTDD